MGEKGKVKEKKVEKKNKEKRKIKNKKIQAEINEKVSTSGSGGFLKFLDIR